MAKNSLGETISREARMTIRQGSQSEPTRPQFVQIPAGHVFFDEDSDYIIMHCVASGVPQPHISWSFNDHPIHENSERIHVHDNGTLFVSLFQYKYLFIKIPGSAAVTLAFMCPQLLISLHSIIYLQLFHHKDSQPDR